MFFTEFAFVTCALYLGIAILVDGLISCVARWKGFSFLWERGASLLPAGLVFFGAMCFFGVPDLVADCDDSSACSNVCSN